MSKGKTFSSEIIKDYSKSPFIEEKDRFKYFSSSVYNVFRQAFYKLGGDSLPITTGDAFLDFLKIHGINEDFTEEELKQRIWRLLAELKFYSDAEGIDIQQTPSFKLEKVL